MNIRKDIKQLKQNAAHASSLLKTLAHPERLMILCRLIEGEYCVGDLLNSTDLSQSAFSQHLAVLRKQGLVKTRKESQTVYYSLASEDAMAILDALHKIYCN